MAEQDAVKPELDFSLVRDDPLYRLQRRLKLIPAGGLGTVRRSVFFALPTWLPLAAWALLSGILFPGENRMTFLQQYGLHVRCLLSIPLLILGEAPLERGVRTVLTEFRRRDILCEADLPRWAEILASTTYQHCNRLSWAGLAALLLVFTVSGGLAREVGWLVSSAELGTDFGSLWFLYVVRPVSIGLLLVWLWRLLLLTGLFWRISHLDLQLAPSHPDRFGGLGMLELLPWCLIPFALAVSGALSGRIAAEMVGLGTSLSSYALMVAVFVAIMVLLLLAPQMAYAPVLLRTRIHGLLEYGELLSRHGRLVRQRWILGRQITEDPLLDAPELGPSVDVNSLYQAVAAINPLAVGLRSLLAAVFATLLPLLPLVLLQFPLTEVLLRLAGALF